ncbi:hypothetical protein [Rhodovulum sp. P5]|uniref:hypothetical protein n=1 Tax=Rhodovulum sp. P5 TaxID=1564506 RepID=UPI0012EB3AE3|nr:hypothetical protein [Rhodovulum sp. P5]
MAPGRRVTALAGPDRRAMVLAVQGSLALQGLPGRPSLTPVAPGRRVTALAGPDRWVMVLAV